MVIDSCRIANCSSFSEGDHSLSYDYIHENGESRTYVWKLKSLKESSHHKSRGKKITAEMTKIELPRSYCRLNLNTGKLTQVKSSATRLLTSLPPSGPSEEPTDLCPVVIGSYNTLNIYHLTLLKTITGDTILHCFEMG